MRQNNRGVGVTPGAPLAAAGGFHCHQYQQRLVGDDLISPSSSSRPTTDNNNNKNQISPLPSPSSSSSTNCSAFGI
ncbi:unnamed protein product [Linum trigynum]|uniref:Uncharacterized protein n=1 Tax=Linum trigynum TaxID=586398 RepID=A0AAV2CV01_9ROSI